LKAAWALLLVIPAAISPAQAAAPDDPAAWSVYITNDNCPDYTWGLTEEQTRQAFADIIRGHLDEMNRTDKEPPENQDRYNMAVTQEALCFVEKYPGRKDELVRRIKEGRIFVSPYLCNSLWGFASAEQTIRTFYPARRLEREWGIPKIEWAEHIEEPCLPWGTATILAGCGIRWLSNPFYNYDSTFRSLKTPPLFHYEGPDGSKIRVVMDPWACNRSSYTGAGGVAAALRVARGRISAAGHPGQRHAWRYQPRLGQPRPRLCRGHRQVQRRPGGAPETHQRNSTHVLPRGR
jgi:hypothetical protein